MQIGDMQQFRESQLSKVERRRQEERQIKKGIYQMQMLIDCQEMETLDKEAKRSQERTEVSRMEQKKAEGQGREQENKKTDVHTEMEKMLSVVKNVTVQNMT